MLEARLVDRAYEPSSRQRREAKTRVITSVQIFIQLVVGNAVSLLVAGDVLSVMFCLLK